MTVAPARPSTLTFHPVTLFVAKAHLLEFLVHFLCAFLPSGLRMLASKACDFLEGCWLPQSLTYPVQGTAVLPPPPAKLMTAISQSRLQVWPKSGVCTACQNQPAAQPNADAPGTRDAFLPREEKKTS